LDKKGLRIRTITKTEEKGKQKKEITPSGNKVVPDYNCDDNYSPWHTPHVYNKLSLYFSTPHGSDLDNISTWVSTVFRFQVVICLGLAASHTR